MFIQTGDTQLLTVSFGQSQQTILALGGWAGSWELWQGPFAHLSRTWRTVAFDHRGTGATIAPLESITVENMVADVLTAYVAKDLALAEELRLRDEDVDHIHNTLFRELLTYMMEQPSNITPCMHLLFIAKNLERMGDHVTAIAEQINYAVTGVLPEDDRPKADKTSQMIS